MNTQRSTQARLNMLRQVYWLSLFMLAATVGWAVALLADLAAWGEVKLRDALNAIEEHL